MADSNPPLVTAVARWLACPACGSRRVGRLPKNEVSPLPAYKCLGCLTELTTGSAKLWHAVFAALALAFVAIGVWVTATKDVLQGVSLTLTALIVLAFCAKAIRRPAVIRVARTAPPHLEPDARR